MRVIMNESIHDYWNFPFPPRDLQTQALDWLESSEAAYNILEAPVGSGKSVIGITYSQWLNRRRSDVRGDSYILTPQRILQEQYEQTFQPLDDISLGSFYGKSNYQCHTKSGSCEIGSMVGPQCKHCPYQQAKAYAKEAADTVLNYKLALTSFEFTEAFKPRELMILDECHTLERHLVDFDALKITYARCKKYNVKFTQPDTLDKAIEWLKNYYLPAMQDKAAELDAQYQELFDKPGTELTRPELQKLRELESLNEHIDETLQMCYRKLEYINQHFVLVSDQSHFQFKRLYGSHSFNKIVKPMANKFLMMSSTILDHEGFCSDLGIPLDQTSFLSIPSEFDTDRRPVYYMPQMKVNAQWNIPERKSERQTYINAIRKLLDMHKEHSGLIHTANFQLAMWLTDQLKDVDTHNIYQHNPESGDDRNDVITAFQNDPNPSVLISPSSTEGLDLKHDLGRFAIFAKVPFGYLGDQWTRRRKALSTRWYQQRTLMDVIQGGGRIVRDATDWGNVYILDANWAFLYNNASWMLPQWWVDAYKKI